jgi:hypothetical protein
MANTAVKDMTLLPKDETALAPQADLASQIVALAANPNFDVAKLQALIEMQERVMRSQAEAAFNEAFSVMQGEIPTVAARKKGDKWKYAPLEDIVEIVRPILQKHGFALSHRTEWPEKNILKVVGILSHRLGHSRQSEFVSAADGSGSKNAIQGLGSANQYGRRYTTNDLLGIATREDDDGAATGRAEVADPKGYDDWRMDLEVIATEKGLPALTEAWKKSPEGFRQHTFNHYRRAWEATKATAAKVKG